MSRVQLLRRYWSAQTKREYQCEITLTSEELTAGQLTEAGCAEADRRAALVGQSYNDTFRLLDEFKGIGTEVIHAE